MDTGYLRRNEMPDMFKNNNVYRSAIGSLLYLATNSRPDIAISTSISARKVTKSSERNIDEELELKCYVDANLGGNRIDCKSNTGYLLLLKRSPIHWVSKKQQCVALLSTEAKYVALAEATQETVWMKLFF
ncbi:uncharacterized protein [Centruroides vittatus]|uniref:uncharacterized protein n=1 Tax=Centruroides vittatus TaxID=120091 RepID=UPI00351066A7